MAIIESIPSRAEQLAAESTVGDKARSALRRGGALFDAGRFWDAHEVWEDVWRDEQRAIRSFYQGLIQIAAGYHHWSVTHRPKGVQTLLDAGSTKLAWYEPHYLGVDVGAVRADARRMRRLAQGRDAAWLAAFPVGDLPHFRWLAPRE